MFPRTDLRTALGRPSSDRTLVGLEHEYSVTRSGRPIDFRALMHRLPIDGRRLDPGDPNAYRCRWGGVITADAEEAEVATPPVEAAGGFARVLEGWGAKGREHLLNVLPGDVDVAGYSTHLSVSLARRRSHRIARFYAGHFSPALMLMMDRRDSPGVRVRIRPGRIELCGEYVTGRALRNASVFALGSVRAAALGSSPPALRFRRQTLHERPGWYVDRSALGVDLYEKGRDADLEYVSGETVSAGEHLERTWATVRPLVGDVAAEEIDSIDRVVRGDLPLPCEGPDDAPAARMAPSGTVFAEILGARVRPGYAVRATLATWDVTVFELISSGRVGYASIPSPLLSCFLARLDDGSLDPLITRYLDGAPRGAVLASHRQTRSPGLFDELGSPTELLAPEIGIGGRGALGAARSRRDKGRRQGPRPGVAVPARRRPWRAIAGAAVILVLIAAVALARRSPGDKGVAAAPVPAVSPVASVTPDEPVIVLPRLGRMVATFDLPVTTYRVQVDGVDPSELTFDWTLSNGCGDFETDGAMARWIHPHDGSPGACPVEPFHPGKVTLAVSGDGFSCTVVYRDGSEEGKGPRPKTCA
ncbi:MAG: hypothetical protein GEU71_06335 [Actinobacteria bacterium]|nr:hypothetical protein [Actinomycetota bacterium]